MVEVVDMIAQLKDSTDVDIKMILATLCTTHNQTQYTLLANVVIEISARGSINIAAHTVHAGIRNLCVETAKAIFSQNDIGQLERLLAGSWSLIRASLGAS